MEKPKEILEIEKFYGIRLTEVKSLHYSERNQYVLNKEKRIITLSLKGNKIFDLLPIKELTSLTNLNLTENQISDLSPIKELTSLTNLNLTENQISDLSPIKKLIYLKTLHLSNNQISDAQPIKGLTSLTDLSLSINQISDLSPLKELTTLKYLYLYSNQISDLSPIKELTSLTNLYLSGNKISDVSPIKKLTSLIILKLTENQISNLSPVKVLTSLIELNLSQNKISDISPIKELTSLTHLYLWSNQISDILPLKGLTSLKCLELLNNQIYDLSPLKGLTSLKELNLHTNQIFDVSSLKGLTSLTYLNLSSNKISDLSPIKELTSLTHLNVSYNQISEFSQFEFIIPLKKLYITVSENPFVKEYQISILEFPNHYDAIVNALLKQKELKQNQSINYILPTKVLLLGNTQSGKSTMMNYLLQEEKSKTIIPSENSTHILSIATLPKELKKDELPKAVFFDFGGQDYYHGLYRAFLNNGALSIIFWNSKYDKNQIRKDERNNSFTRDFNRDYWLNQLKYSEERENKSKNTTDKNIKTNTILMVQTHADKGSKRATYNGDCDDMHIENEFFVALNQEAIETNATHKISLDYFETSLLEQINLKKETVTETKWYKELLDYIQQVKGKEATTLDEIGKYYNREADIEKKLLPEVLRVLATTGLLLYYKDDDDLKDIAWLDPTATIQDIHDTIFDKKKMKDSKGIISKEDFEKNDSKIIKLLCNQKVVFLDPNPEDINYIIPGYLPLTTDDSKLYDLLIFDLVEPNFVVKFKYFIPFGLINQLICYYGNNHEKKHYWRDQLLFTINGCKVLIQLDFSNLEISVSIKSKDTKKSLDEIERKIFEDILDLYYGEKRYYDNYDELENSEDTVITIDDKLRTEFYKSFLNIEKTYKSPDDMYLSVDNKTFIHHKTLENKELTFSKITAFGFDERVEIQNGKEIKIRTLNESKTREQSSGLYKNFTKNESIKSMKKVFISYSRKDVDYKDELKKHLNMLATFEIADNWSCEEITIGKWDAQIQKELQEADLIIYMLSANFFSSKYILDKEVKVGMDLIDSDKSKDILCVVVSEFVGLDKLKNATENNQKSETQEALLRLSEQQYLPYAFGENTTTGNREEKIISLKEHTNKNTLESALTSITNKVLEFCSK